MNSYYLIAVFAIYNYIVQKIAENILLIKWIFQFLNFPLLDLDNFLLF